MRCQAICAIGVGALFLGACVAPVPKGDVSDVLVSQVQAGNPNPGVSVRWGGTVVGVRNKTDITELEVVSRPLLRSGRPARNDQSHGRFLAEVKGFLDPEIIEIGRDITLTGNVVQMKEGQVGEAAYSFPVLTVYQYHFWKPLADKPDPWRYAWRPWLDHPANGRHHWPFWHHRQRDGVSVRDRVAL